MRNPIFRMAFRWGGTASLVLTLGLGSPSAGKAQYQPLEDGYSWLYSAIGTGDIEGQTVVGQTPIFGGTPWVIEYGPSVNNDVLSNFWTSDPDGDVHLWGFNREGDFGWVYDPPILVLDAPLQVGDSWSQTIDIYEYPEMVYLSTFEIAFQVYEDVVLVLPAGEFSAFGIGEIVPRGGLFPENISLSGELREPGFSATMWWSYGVGRAQYRSGETYQLTSFNFPVPVEEATWGQIKATFFGPER